MGHSHSARTFLVTGSGGSVGLIGEKMSWAVLSDEQMSNE